MSMSDHIKHFMLIRSPSFGKRLNWILLFYHSGRTSTHIENILPILQSRKHCTLF